jgi:hypothetical protein
MSQNSQHPFQQWLEQNGAVDVRFYPANPSDGTVTKLLDDAMKAVSAYERGDYVAYEDTTKYHDAEH